MWMVAILSLLLLVSDTISLSPKYWLFIFDRMALNNDVCTHQRMRYKLDNFFEDSWEPKVKEFNELSESFFYLLLKEKATQDKVKNFNMLVWN